MGPKSTDRRLGVNLRVLTDSQIEDIHLASLEILSRTGIIIQHEKARDLLAEAGAAIDGELVRIPPDLAKAALAAAPERVLLYNRRGEPAVDLGADRSYFGTGSDTPTYLDPYTGELKESNRDSVRTIARLCDALPNMDFVMSMGIAKERGTSSFVHQYAAMTEGTVKPIVFTAQGEKDIGPIYEIALALAGYHSDHGVYPKNLKDLVPKYVDQLPEDMFTGDPFHYKRKGKGYLLYSVGLNTKDDGGRNAWRDPAAEDDPDYEGDDIAIRTPKGER